MPGLGAGKKIFKYLKLPGEYQVHYLHWLIPYNKESLQEYTKRLIAQIKDENPILIGVSFGGIIVQEIAKQIPVKQVIIISSIKHHTELKPFYKLAYKTKLYKILPAQLLRNLDRLKKLPLDKPIKKKIRLYQIFLELDDPYYIRWSIEQVFSWRQRQIPENLIQISGEKDIVFPIKFIKDPKIVVLGGRHEMIVTKVRWFNRNLSRFLAIYKHPKNTVR